VTTYTLNLSREDESLYNINSLINVKVPLFAVILIMTVHLTGLFANVPSLLLRREGFLPALPGNSMAFPFLLQGNGYGNTGETGKLEGARELGYDAFPAQPWMLH
jgi:hypothetical protein